MNKYTIIAVAIFLLTGCASTKPPAAPTTLLSAPSLRANASFAAVDKEFYQVLAGCQQVLTGFERQALEAKQWSVGIQSAGGFLGAVLLPVAIVKGMANSVVTLLGSLSGYANTELSVIRNEALDAASVLAQRASVLSAMQAGLKRHFDALGKQPVSTTELQGANDELRVACISYLIASPQADPIMVPQ